MEVVVNASPVAEGKKKGPDQWEIESWCRTLVEAEEIKADPEKMKLVGPMLKKKAKAYKSIADLRAAAAEMEMEEMEDEEDAD